MKKIVIAALLSAFVSVPALAAEKSMSAASPFYVGAQLGDGYIGGVAGYQIDKMYSAELTYIKFDEISAFGISANAASIGVAGVAMFPLEVKGAPGLSLFARAGFERTSVKVEIAFPGLPTTSSTVTDTGLVLGGGAQYAFNKNFSGRLGIDIEGEADTLYLSALYKF